MVSYSRLSLVVSLCHTSDVSRALLPPFVRLTVSNTTQLQLSIAVLGFAVVVVVAVYRRGRVRRP